MANDFYTAWTLSRGRFDAEIADLNHAQLNHRLYPGSLTIGEMVLHLFGVEVWFMNQIAGTPIEDEFLTKLCKTATEGVVNDNPFPFSAEEITPELITKAQEIGRAAIDHVMQNASEETMNIQVQSALGPIIDGRGAFTRMTFHPAYHHGQVYQIKSAPGFPKT